MNIIAIDLGGTYIKVGFISNNHIIDNETISAYSENDFSLTMSRVNKCINALLKRNQRKPAQISGIGISIPGIVDTFQNKVLSVNKKHVTATQFDFNKWSKKIGIPHLVMDNDARSALLGEWQYGAGKGCDNIVMITLGTGIGGATLINGKLLYGKHFQAGCLGGHFTINYSGNICSCGNVGCVESEASSWKLPELIKNNPLYSNSKWIDETTLDFKTLFEYCRKNEALALQVTQNCLKAWATAAINMIHAYDPETVIFGGGIMSSHDIILPFIKNQTNKYAWTPWGKAAIKKAELENLAALLGLNYLLTN